MVEPSPHRSVVRRAIAVALGCVFATASLASAQISVQRVRSAERCSITGRCD